LADVIRAHGVFVKSVEVSDENDDPRNGDVIELVDDNYLAVDYEGFGCDRSVSISWNTEQPYGGDCTHDSWRVQPLHSEFEKIAISLARWFDWCDSEDDDLDWDKFVQSWHFICKQRGWPK
jgi:hypothetical protein